VAESCTGGLLGGAITSIPGSSLYFSGGVVAYGNTAKISLLGVPTDLIAARGAVSREVALAMAEGVLSLFRATSRSPSPACGARRRESRKAGGDGVDSRRRPGRCAYAHRFRFPEAARRSDGRRSGPRSAPQSTSCDPMRRRGDESVPRHRSSRRCPGGHRVGDFAGTGLQAPVAWTHRRTCTSH